MSKKLGLRNHKSTGAWWATIVALVEEHWTADLDVWRFESPLEDGLISLYLLSNLLHQECILKKVPQGTLFDVKTKPEKIGFYQIDAWNRCLGWNRWNKQIQNRQKIDAHAHYTESLKLWIANETVSEWQAFGRHVLNWSWLIYFLTIN